MDQHRIVIVGGGLAGLACAKHLQEHGQHDFLLVTDQIGGRASASCESLNFGAFYARKDYKHIWPYIVARRPVSVRYGNVITKDGSRSMTEIALRHPIAAVRFYLLLRKFDAHFVRFNRRCEVMSHKRALEADPYLLKLYQTPAKTFLDAHGLTRFGAKVIAPVMRLSTFQHLEQLTAIAVLITCLIMKRSAFECSFDSSDLVQPFMDKICIDRIVSVRKVETGWQLDAQSGNQFGARTLIMATPVDVTKKLTGVPDRHNRPVRIHMAMVRGQVKSPYGRSRYTAFLPESDDVGLVKYDDGSFLFCSNRSNYDLDRYFTSYEVLAEKFWDPAVYLGQTLVESKQSEDLYLIGDFVLGGMELAYLSGMSAAHEISTSTADS